jgi:hypothetical protein
MSAPLVLLAACADQTSAPTEPDLLKRVVPLTATPSALDFASPTAATQSERLTVQYTTLGAPGQYELDFTATGFQEHLAPLDLSAEP